MRGTIVQMNSRTNDTRKSDKVSKSIASYYRFTYELTNSFPDSEYLRKEKGCALIHPHRIDMKL